MLGRILLAVTLVICVFVFIFILIGPFIFPNP